MSLQTKFGGSHRQGRGHQEEAAKAQAGWMATDRLSPGRGPRRCWEQTATEWGSERDDQPTPLAWVFLRPLTEASTSLTLPVLGPDLIQGDQASWGHCSPCCTLHGQVSPLPDLGAAPGLDQMAPPACLCSPPTQAALHGTSSWRTVQQPQPRLCPHLQSPVWQGSLPPKFSEVDFRPPATPPPGREVPHLPLRKRRLPGPRSCALG